ncbi:unnamed protein product [Lathyrus sativus]|nr:unnamed protein product [Lathyrus sativus]
MSVLVNGSTTKDFKMERRLRQGDLLSLFLFVIVMEGLTGLKKKAVELGDFRGFQFNDEDSVDMLQFADDTIVGLKVNFYKSKLYDINIGDWFLYATSSFLACNVDSLPFKFLGVMAGESPKKLEM